MWNVLEESEKGNSSLLGTGDLLKETSLKRLEGRGPSEKLKPKKRPQFNYEELNKTL